MLLSLQWLRQYNIRARNTFIGSVSDFLFDERDSHIRHIVVDTGSWLPGRQILIPSIAIEGSPDWSEQAISISLTEEEIESSPSIKEHMPVSKIEEEKLLSHYHYPMFWSPAGVSLPIRENLPDDASKGNGAEKQETSNLRSFNEVTGYAVNSLTQTFGHLDDFIVDDNFWTLRFAVVDTKNWLPAPKVLASTSWISHYEWDNQSVHFELTEQQIKNCPEFHPEDPINKELETRLYDYRGKPQHWEKDKVSPEQLLVF